MAQKLYSEHQRQPFVYRGNRRWPRGKMTGMKRLKSGWDLVEPKLFAHLFYQEPRPYFIGNMLGKVDVTCDEQRYTIWNRAHFLAMFAHPHCPYGCAIAKNPYNPSDIRFQIVIKPIEQLLACNPQLFFETMDATEERNRATAQTQKELSVARAEALVRATEPSVEKIKSGLQAADRVTYNQIKSEILNLISEGKINPLSNLEVERITLMRMVEFKGLMEVLATDTHGVHTDGETGEIRSVYTREAVAMMQLMRQIGNEAQRMTEGSSTTKKNGKSVFDALQELVKNGDVKVEITADRRPKPVDAEFRELLGSDQPKKKEE